MKHVVTLERVLQRWGQPPLCAHLRLALLRSPSVSLALGFLFALGGWGRIEARVIRPGAELRVDFEVSSTPTPIPQPNGPARPRALAPGCPTPIQLQSRHFVFPLPSEGFFPRDFHRREYYEGSHFVEVAVDVERRCWREYFGDSIQELVNYVAGLFELLNGILLRDAGVRTEIVHLHVWRECDRRLLFRPEAPPDHVARCQGYPGASADDKFIPGCPPPPTPSPEFCYRDAYELINYQNFWNRNWPRCSGTATPTPGIPTGGCIPRDAVYVLSFDAGDHGGGHGWLAGACSQDKERDRGQPDKGYAWVSLGPTHDLSRDDPSGGPYFVHGRNAFWGVHSFAHEFTHVLGLNHGDANYDCGQCSCDPARPEDLACADRNFDGKPDGSLQSFCGNCLGERTPRAWTEHLRLDPYGPPMIPVPTQTPASREIQLLRTFVDTHKSGCLPRQQENCSKQLADAIGAPCTDTDGDGICDPCDNCPRVSNIRQQDSDGNGTGDQCQCTGDCNGDDQVTIDELIVGVRIALQEFPVGSCPQMDRNVNGEVTVEEITAAVNNALAQCPEPLPSPPPADTSLNFELTDLAGYPGETRSFALVLRTGSGSPASTGLNLEFAYPSDIITEPTCELNTQSLPGHELEQRRVASGRKRTLVHDRNWANRTFPADIGVYRCTAQIAATAPPGTYALTASWNTAADPGAREIPSRITRQGRVVVYEPGQGGGGGCHVSGAEPGQGKGLAGLALFALLVWGLRQRGLGRALGVGVLLLAAARAPAAAQAPEVLQLPVEVSGSFEELALSSPADVEASRAGPQRWWQAYDLEWKEQGREVCGKLVVMGLAELGAGSFCVRLGQRPRSVTGEVRNGRGEVVGEVHGELYATGARLELATAGRSRSTRAQVALPVRNTTAWREVLKRLDALASGHQSDLEVQP